MTIERGGALERVLFAFAFVLWSCEGGKGGPGATGAAGTSGTAGAAGSGSAAGTGGGGAVAGAEGNGPGGSAGVAGSSGGGGSVGGAAGGNADGGATLTSCPTEQPTTGPACTGTLYCTYVTGCSCAGCCAAVYRCTDGRLTSSGLDFNDSCIQGGCGIGVVCDLTRPETCNDDPDAGGIRGTCSFPGICICPPGQLNPDSGRCLAQP